MRLIRASFAAMAIAAFASSSACAPQKGDTFKRAAGQDVFMPIPNAPVVESKAKQDAKAGKPEEVKPKEAKPPEFAKPVSESEVGKKYDKIRTLDNGYVLLESNTNWLILMDGKKELMKGKILSKEDTPLRIVFRIRDKIWFIEQDGWPALMPVDPGGSVTPRPQF